MINKSLQNATSALFRLRARAVFNVLPTPPTIRQSPHSACSPLGLIFKVAAGGLLVAALAGCGGSETSSFSPMANLGAMAFNDPILSASGRQSCASCHSPETGHTAPNDHAVQLGGPNLDVPGLRNSQTIRYLANNSAFHFDAEGTPTGGFFWDGRADSLVRQAEGPLLGAREMANADKATVVEKIKQSSWAQEFEAVFGRGSLENVDEAFAKLGLALQQFQNENAALHAFTSKYDAVLRGSTQLTPQESRGLALFNDPLKGNCASCHTSTKNANGDHPLFTDFTYDNLGIPRNLDIPANADPSYFDLGLCAARVELTEKTELCGAFKVPTLRNVALRKSFFHNGKFKTLKDVLSFYVQRDTNPDKWYPLKPDGSVDKFNDLPEIYRGNVNTTEGPYDRKMGDAPALSNEEIDDVIAFLKTLTDGWTPP